MTNNGSTKVDANIIFQFEAASASNATSFVAGIRKSFAVKKITKSFLASQVALTVRSNSISVYTINALVVDVIICTVRIIILPFNEQQGNEKE